MKKILKFLLKFIIVLIIAFGLFLLYFTISDYTPKEKIIISEGENVAPIESNKLTIMSWNIGYAGLGDNMDFFYDGGEKVRDTKQRTIENLQAIKNVLNKHSYVDFLLLQEVDIDAKRTYYINEKDTFDKTLNKFVSFYAPNYKVQYVPVPISSPMGYVEAGLVTYSKYVPMTSIRYQYPGNYPWPTKLFMLDRCFLCNTYPLNNGKQLILINTHNSAFDGDGSLKRQQLEYLKKYITDEYKKGNYVIVGGDWNQNPPNFDNSKFGDYSDSEQFVLKSIDKNYMPEDWKWVFDNNLPTNRSLVYAYDKEKTSTTIIDFFLTSPNIKNTSIETINLNFKNADHQPILAEFKLKN